VDTPYLAAVVKGTTFTVSVGATGASVHVHEGAVEVATNDRRQSILTRTGQISNVFATSLSQIFTTGVTGSGGVDVDSVWNSPMPEVEIVELTSTSPFGATPARPQTDIGLRFGKTFEKHHEALGLHAINRIATVVRHADSKLFSAQKTSITVNSATIAVKNSDDQTPDAKEDLNSRRADADQSHWTVIETKGVIKVDGANYSVYGFGIVRTLPPGTRVETGADGRMVLARGTEQFSVDPESTVILADATKRDAPKAIRGTVERFAFATKEGNAESSVDTDGMAQLSGPDSNDAVVDHADRSSPNPFASNSQGVSRSTHQGDVASELKQPAPHILPKPPQGKNAKVRTQVISGVTLFLYAITAALLIFFGVRAYLKRIHRRRSDVVPEDAVTVRVRQIKGD
jgi:hypothetical protein